jgi:hypothetical protein
MAEGPAENNAICTLQVQLEQNHSVLARIPRKKEKEEPNRLLLPFN